MLTVKEKESVLALDISRKPCVLQRSMQWHDGGYSSTGSRNDSLIKCAMQQWLWLHFSCINTHTEQLTTGSKPERWRLQLNFNAKRLKQQLAKAGDMAISIQRLTSSDYFFRAFCFRDRKISCCCRTEFIKQCQASSRCGSSVHPWDLVNAMLQSFYLIWVGHLILSLPTQGRSVKQPRVVQRPSPSLASTLTKWDRLSIHLNVKIEITRGSNYLPSPIVSAQVSASVNFVAPFQCWYKKWHGSLLRYHACPTLKHFILFLCQKINKNPYYPLLLTLEI